MAAQRYSDRATHAAELDSLGKRQERKEDAHRRSLVPLVEHGGEGGNEESEGNAGGRELHGSEASCRGLPGLGRGDEEVERGVVVPLLSLAWA